MRVWLAENEPPSEWEGSRMEYAYTEMPDPMKGVGLAGALLFGAGLWWWASRRKHVL